MRRRLRAALPRKWGDLAAQIVAPLLAGAIVLGAMYAAWLFL